jgi:hypothetical protein
MYASIKTLQKNLPGTAMTGTVPADMCYLPFVKCIQIADTGILCDQESFFVCQDEVW